MNPAFRSAVGALGTELNREVIAGSCRLCAERMDPALEHGVETLGDLPYGDHARQVLDLFRPTQTTAPRPVLIYVHGGGFLGGDKTMRGQPFYRNVGCWAVRNGMIGVTINYRLAPQAPWPCGAEDLAAAVGWVRAHVADQGGDPSRIFVMGQSAGSVHVADYLVRGADLTGIAGAILSSCIYDPSLMRPSPLNASYYGAGDPAGHAGFATLPGLLETPIPLMLTVSEFDEIDFQRQATLFCTAYQSRHGRFAPMLRLSGHNHLTSVFQLGTIGDTLGPEIRLFVDSHTSA